MSRSFQSIDKTHFYYLGTTRNTGGIKNITMCFDDQEAERILTNGNINVLIFYLMGKGNYANYEVLNRAALKVLDENKRIGTRRRQVLQKFIGKVAKLTFEGKLLKECIIEEDS